MRRSTALRDRGAAIRTASRIGRVPRGLGDLLPIRKIVRTIEEGERSGKMLPGNPLPVEYRQWREAVKRGAIPADTPPPGDLRALNREQYELYRKQYVGELMKDLRVYIPFVYDKVFTQPGNRPASRDEAVDLLYQYACRQISRLMPGFAKIVLKKVSSGVNLVGDWNEPIPPGDLPPAGKPGGRGGSSRPKPYEPPPKEEVIEVCSVTHVQLEHTLRKDLDLLVAAVVPGRPRSEEDLEPVSGLPAPPPRQRQQGPKPKPRATRIRGVLPAPDPTMPTFEPGYDRPGSDYRNLSATKPEQCHSACHRDRRCRAFTFVEAWKKCFLKDSIREPNRASGMVSGVRPAITITRAEYGHNVGMSLGSRATCGGLGGCGRTMDSNIQPDVARQCDGKVSCRYTVRHPHPPHGHGTRAVMILYHCGDGVTTKRSERPGEAFGQTVDVSCRDEAREASRRAAGMAEDTAVVERVTLDSSPRHVHGDLWTDIGKTFGMRQYKEVTFHEVAKRLLNFYRKTGTSRNFERAMVQAKEKVKSMANRVVKKEAPELTRRDSALTHQAQPETVDTRNRREVLRRKVERWTYGYEYEQVGSLLRKTGGRLLQRYREVEKAVLQSFWTDCEEVQTICHDPKTRYERDFCIRCAERAVRMYCIEGQERDHCRSNDPRLRARGGATFFNWLAVRMAEEPVLNPDFIQGSLGDRRLEETVVRNVVRRLFLPQKPDQKKGISDEGLRSLEALPITPWQRCVLWHPDYERSPNVCSKADGRMDDLKKQRNVRWERAMLFRMVLRDPQVQLRLEEPRTKWGAECRRDRRRCDELARQAEQRARDFFGEEDPAGAGVKSDLAKVGDAIGDTLAPIVGALLGMLLKAEGMDQMVKTLAQAAGLTPEQSVDCEDPEYRREVLQLPAGDLDNKRTCLLKVFAKNFGTILESIVVMLGNKLVDWGVDMLRSLLQPVKSGLVSAAGSVPFAGGFLAMLVDLGWELLMNFGAKIMLKSFVVAKLPEWLQLKKLAEALKPEELLKNPILAVIAGIVIQLVESAVAYGDKSLAVAGAASILTGIQHALQNDPKNHFWLRALLYAKRELGRDGPRTESPEEVLKFIAKGMIRGFAAAIERNLDGQAPAGEKSPREQFRDAVREIEALFDGEGWARVQRAFTTDPVGALVELIGKKIGPVVMPIVTSFVSMPDWAKQLLNRIGTNVSATLEDLRRSGGVQVPQVIARIVDTFEPVGRMLLDGLPVHDEALKRMILDGYGALVGALRDFGNLERNYLRQPWKIVEGVVGVARDFLRAKVGELLRDPALSPEKTLVESAVAAILDVLGNERQRGEILTSSGVNAQAILSRVADLVQPYAAARLRQLAAGSGLEELIVAAVNELFGPDGPFKRGGAFFENLGSFLGTRGPAIARQALDAIAGIVRRQAERMGGGPVVAALVQGVLGALGRAVQSPRTLTGGAAGVLALLRDAFQPLLDAIAPAGPAGGQASALTGMLRNVLGGVLDLFGSPDSLTRLASEGARALGGLAARVATGLKEAVTSLLGRAIPDAALRTVVDRAVDRILALLSDPAQVARLRGEQVLDLVKEIAQGLFGYAKGKIVEALGSLAGAAGEAVRSVASGILDEVERIFGDPARLRSLATGGARDLLATVARALQAPVRSLVERRAPAPVREAIGQAAGELMSFLAQPTQLEGLGRMSPADLLPRLAPTAQRLLEGILRTAVPADAWAPIQEALGRIQAVLASPASAVEGAGQAARQAIDTALAAALVRIPDVGLRELASDLVAMVGDLVSSDAARSGLRTNAQALVERIASIAARCLAGLLPAGPIRELAARATEGLREVFAHSAGVAQGLAQRAEALLPGLGRALGGLVRDGLARAIPDGAIAAAVGSLAEEVLGLVAEPSRWQELQRGGVGYVLSRLAPLARDFAVAMLGRLPGEAGEVLRGVVEALVSSATRLLSSPEAVARFAENAVSVLVSLGVGAVRPAVLGLVERATGSADVAVFVRTALDELEAILANPAQLQSFLRRNAAQAFETLLSQAQRLVERLVGTVVRDDDLRTLAQQGLGAVLAFVQRAVSGGGSGLDEAAKAIIARLLPAVAGLLKARLGPIFPHDLSALRTLIERGLDRLVTFGIDLLQHGRAAWEQLVGGGRIFGEIVQAIVPLVKEPVVRAVSWRPLQGLLSRLLDKIGELLADPARLVRSFQNADTAMRELLPKLKDILGPFVQEALVTPLPAGIGKDFLKTVLDAGLDVLGDPSKLQAYTRTGGAPKRVVACILDDLKPAILGQLPGGRGGALYQVLSGGMDVMAQQALGGATCARAR